MTSLLKIFVKIPAPAGTESVGFTMTIYAKRSDFADTLKAMMADDVNKLPDQLKLFYDGDELDHSFTLGDILENESTLDLVILPGEDDGKSDDDADADTKAKAEAESEAIAIAATATE